MFSIFFINHFFVFIDFVVWGWLNWFYFRKEKRNARLGKEGFSNLPSFPDCIFFISLVDLYQATCFGDYKAENNVYSVWMTDFFLPPVSFCVKPRSVKICVFCYRDKTDVKFLADDVLFLLFCEWAPEVRYNSLLCLRIDAHLHFSHIVEVWSHCCFSLTHLNSICNLV